MKYGNHFWLYLLAQEVVDVATQHGVIRGQVVSSPFGTEVERFLGIPFAVPPIGSRRFGNPELYGEFQGGCLQNYLLDFPHAHSTLSHCGFAI